MSSKAARALVGLVASLAIASSASTQELSPAPIPVVLQPASPPAGPAAARTVSAAPAPAAPALPPGPMPPLPPGPSMPFDDPGAPPWRGDVIVEHPCLPPCGWFAGAGVSVLVPHVNNRLATPVTINADPVFDPHIMGAVADPPGHNRPQRASVTETVHLPTAPLEWAGAPQVSLGYRMPQGLGEFVATYRLLNTEGTAVLPGFDLDGSPGWLRSRLSVHVIDLDYASAELAPAPFWDMRWRAGVRVGGVFFDSDASAWYVEEKTSNNFWGAGPHVGLELARTLPMTPELALYTGLDSAALVGEIHQSFSKAFFFDDGTAVGGATTRRQTQVVPTLRFQAGLRWTPAPARGLRVFGGYELESWWYLGQVGDSRAELLTQGLFVRAEWPF